MRSVTISAFNKTLLGFKIWGFHSGEDSSLRPQDRGSMDLWNADVLPQTAWHHNQQDLKY